jgi:elongation factor P hydroxylase
MTTPYNSHSSAISAMNNLIDKHVQAKDSALHEHYLKAEETRALLKRLGCWPKPTGRPAEIRGKKPKNGKTASERGRDAYEWARKNNATYTEAAERFCISADSIHSYRQYRKLPKLRK